jgi:hypothetical protein
MVGNFTTMKIRSIQQRRRVVLAGSFGVEAILSIPLHAEKEDEGDGLRAILQ